MKDNRLGIINFEIIACSILEQRGKFLIHRSEFSIVNIFLTRNSKYLIRTHFKILEIRLTKILL